MKGSERTVPRVRRAAEPSRRAIAGCGGHCAAHVSVATANSNANETRERVSEFAASLFIYRRVDAHAGPHTPHPQAQPPQDTDHRPQEAGSLRSSLHPYVYVTSAVRFILKTAEIVRTARFSCRVAAARRQGPRPGHGTEPPAPRPAQGLAPAGQSRRLNERKTLAEFRPHLCARQMTPKSALTLLQYEPVLRTYLRLSSATCTSEPCSRSSTASSVPPSHSLMPPSLEASSGADLRRNQRPAVEEAAHPIHAHLQPG